MKIKDLLSIDVNDFNKMKKGDLKQAINTMRNAIRKRIKRFQDAGVDPYELGVFEKLKDPLSVKGKTINQLRHEFVRAKSILDSPTGSLSGYKSIRSDSIFKLSQRGIDVSPEQYDTFWKAYNRLSKTDQGSGVKANKEYKYNLLREISEYMNGEDMDLDSVIEIIYGQLESIYDATMESGTDQDALLSGLEF